MVFKNIQIIFLVFVFVFNYTDLFLILYTTK